MTTFGLQINDQSFTVNVDDAMPLLWVLRDVLGLTGTKFGCGLGLCGSCTVLVDDEPVRSCITPVRSVAETEITTLEGLGTVENPHPIQKAFIDEQAVQCGFCLSGVIMTAKAFLEQNPKATDGEIQQAMSNVLCRCHTHVRMMKAIMRYAQEVRS